MEQAAQRSFRAEASSREICASFSRVVWRSERANSLHTSATASAGVTAVAAENFSMEAAGRMTGSGRQIVDPPCRHRPARRASS
jgi:hypothetical protein